MGNQSEKANISNCQSLQLRYVHNLVTSNDDWDRVVLVAKGQRLGGKTRGPTLIIAN